MILKDERRGKDLTVGPDGARLGRDPTLELVFDEGDDVVSALHCRVVKHDDGAWWLEDLGSTNGTWLNGQRITAPVKLETGSRFSLGQRGPVLKVVLPGQVSRTQQEPAVQLAAGDAFVRLRRVKGGEDLQANGPEVVLGRSAGCQIALRTVADTVVSKRHAKLTFIDTVTVMLSDLGSRNGTYVNGTPVQGRTRVRPGDRIMLGWQGPLFEIRVLGTQSMPEGEGAPYAPDEEPHRSFSGMLAVAGDEARADDSRQRMRTGVFVKSMARQIARDASPGFRVAVVVAFLAVLAAVGLVWRSSQQRAAEAEQRLQEAQLRFTEQLRHADSLQERAALELADLRNELATARSSAVRRELIDSLERRVHDAEQRAAHQATAPAPAAVPTASLDFTSVARENARAVGLVIVRFPSDSVMGSGFVITPSGYFVTNRHVVQEEGRSAGQRQVQVVMAETNVTLPADVVSVSSAQNQDVAILKIRGYRGPAVRSIDWLGRGAQQGAQAAMIGFPFGTSLAVDNAGYIHSTLFGGYIAQTGEWIRFAANTYAGVSGSPVFNADGQVIAVHFGAPREGPGLGISVPMSKVRRWLPSEARAELGL